MKKKHCKKLKLRKKAISSFDPYKVKGGGYSHSNVQHGTREHCCYPL